MCIVNQNRSFTDMKLSKFSDSYFTDPDRDPLKEVMGGQYNYRD